MAWLSISFDGEGLAFAKMTRHDRSAQAWMLIGDAETSDGETVYPTAARLQGQRLSVGDVQAMLERSYATGTATQDGDDILAACRMPASRMWAESLRALLPFAAKVRHPHVRFHEGQAHVLVEVDDGEDMAKRLGLASGADVQVLDDVDLGPWSGLAAHLPA